MLTTKQAMGMIETLDIAVFQVNTGSTLSDRTSFLRVQNFARSMLGRYVYLEVGSDIGGDRETTGVRRHSLPRSPHVPRQSTQLFANF